MSKEHNASKKAKIAPYQHPLWNALLWVFSYFVATCVGLVLFYIFRDDIGGLFGVKDSLWTIENCIKVVIGVFALFAFVVTIWRGNLHAHQVSGQMEQIKLGREQLEKTEDNNIAKLLVDGTKLLGNGTSEAEKIAGIACLANIIQGQSSFSEQAVEVLRRFIYTHECETKVELVNYRAFSADENKYDIIFTALDAMEQFGELKQELVTLQQVAIIGEKAQTHYKWLETVVRCDTTFWDRTLDERAIFIDCKFYKCQLGGTAIYERGNYFSNVVFDSFAFRKRNLDYLRHCQKVKMPPLNFNVFEKKSVFFNSAKITEPLMRNYLLNLGVAPK